MHTLVNYSGDDEFCNSRSFTSANTGLTLSIGSHVDVYCPPRKRSRINGPYLIKRHVYGLEKRQSIEILPDECLFEIFRRLPGGQERSASACVSKRWLTVLTSVRSSEICKKVNEKSNDVERSCDNEDDEMEGDGYLTRCLEGKKATDTRLAAISVGTSRRGGLGKLIVRGSNAVRGVTNLGLSAIARGCPSLKALTLWNIPTIGDEGLCEIARECHSLEKLDLCQCPSISDKGLIAIANNCPNLTSISFESCKSIGNECLKAIGKHCQKLQSIAIKDCRLIGDHGIANLMSTASNALKKVKLEALNITDFSLAVLGHYGIDINTLVLTGLQNVSQRGLWVMGNARGLQKLASLTITSCMGTTDVSLEAVGKGCPNLKHVCLRKCCFVSDNGLEAFAKVAKSLENLQLEECNRVSQNGIVNMLSNCESKLKSLGLVKCLGIKDLPSETVLLSPCKSLRSLSIRSCPGFGTTSLAMVGKLCPKLHQLDLSGLCGITDAAVLSLIENCDAGLVKVNLTNCFNLTDEVVSSLARLHGGTLQLLNLDGCRKVTDASLVSIADYCPLLNDLDVSKCSITDSGVGILSRGVQLNLQILSLSGCSMISNKSVSALKKLGMTLVGLNLLNCSSMSNSTVERLVKNLRKCDILY